MDAYVPPVGQSQPTGQTIADIAYSNGAWVLLNSSRGDVSRSTNNGSSWSSWATPVGTNWSVIRGNAITSNNGGSKIVMSVRGDTNNSWKQFYYSSDSGASWNSGTSISTSFGRHVAADI